MRVRVKICGVRTLDDALAAEGADMLGFNFYPPSPRYVTPAACAALVGALRDRGVRATMVGVFVNATLEDVAATLEQCDLDLAQLSGDEPPALARALGARAFKAIRPRTLDEAHTALGAYPRRAAPPALLVDAARGRAYGGTGHLADWGLARALAACAPILLAGGLRPENVMDALAAVRPWGVDVASGVESAPGRKDPERVAAFVRAVRQFEQEYAI